MWNQSGQHRYDMDLLLRSSGQAQGEDVHQQQQCHLGPGGVTGRAQVTTGKPGGGMQGGSDALQDQHLYLEELSLRREVKPNE